MEALILVYQRQLLEHERTIAKLTERNLTLEKRLKRLDSLLADTDCPFTSCEHCEDWHHVDSEELVYCALCLYEICQKCQTEYALLQDGKHGLVCRDKKHVW